LINKIIIRSTHLALAVAIIMTCWVASAWGAEKFEFTRETYDLMMRWVNFIILAALIIKYARRPIANFLKEKRDEVAKSIEKLETQKQTAKDQLLQYQNQLTASENQLAQIKQKIIAEGEQLKAKLIADAQTDSRILMETAQLRISHMIRETHGRIRTELIDTAAEIALAKLSETITAADNDKLIHQWMDAAQN
jgi:F-type H+-transporting ATPase subunit b